MDKTPPPLDCKLDETNWEKFDFSTFLPRNNLSKCTEKIGLKNFSSAIAEKNPLEIFHLRHWTMVTRS